MSNTQEYNENAIKSYENFAEDFFNNFDKYKKYTIQKHSS